MTTASIEALRVENRRAADLFASLSWGTERADWRTMGVSMPGDTSAAASTTSDAINVI